MITAESTIVGQLGFDEQVRLVAELRDVVKAAPLIQPSTNGLDMTVRISNAGPWGWLSDENGYRYADHHPRTGRPWPPIPEWWLELADRFADKSIEPLPWDCAHVVFYGPGAKLGQHRDKTEHDKRGQIITFSLGDPAVWRVEDENGVKTSTLLTSGMVTRLAGSSRSILHEIVRVDANPTRDMLNPSPLTGPGRIIVSIRSGAGPR